jgi:hypothetical protein
VYTKIVLALSLALAAPAWGAVIMVSKVPVFTGTTTGSQKVTEPRGLGACLWQRPGFMAWFNLYTLDSIRVHKEARTNPGGWTTTVRFGGHYSDTVEVKGHWKEDEVVNSINARLAACSKGE